MKRLLIGFSILFLTATGYAANDDVEYCQNLAVLSGCDAVYAPCVAQINAADRQAEKNAEWSDACSFDLSVVGACAQQVGPEGSTVDVCKCIQEQAECPKVSIGNCVAYFAAQDQYNRQSLRLTDAFSACFVP